MSTLYKLEEIKLCNGKNGAKTWIVLHDIVYDVTEYLNDVREFSSEKKKWRETENLFLCFFFLQHPGGGELIIDVAGRDCTKEFYDIGHSSDAKQTMKKFKIGELVEVNINLIDKNNLSKFNL